MLLVIVPLALVPLAVVLLLALFVFVLLLAFFEFVRGQRNQDLRSLTGCYASIADGFTFVDRGT